MISFDVVSESLKNQAVKMLGTVDFLGNPLGLFLDVASGFKELVFDGSIGGFVSGVGCGVSSSVAKVLSPIGDP